MGINLTRAVTSTSHKTEIENEIIRMQIIKIQI